MGLFGEMANMAAKGASFAMKKMQIKKDVEAMSLRSRDELSAHYDIYNKLAESESNKFAKRREHYIVSYMFTQVMTDNDAHRDFSFLDQMPEEYRTGEEFKKYLDIVQNEYYYVRHAQAFIDAEMTAPTMILGLKDLLYFKEIREEVQEILASEPFLQSESMASASIFSDSESVEDMMQKIRNFSITDITEPIATFSDGYKALKNGDYKKAIKLCLFTGYEKADFDNLKIGLLHFAMDAEQDEATVEIYEVYEKICGRLFGLSTIKNIEGKEKVKLYPSVDMVIGEVARHIHAGTAEQYNGTLKDWLECCGESIAYGQLTVMQEVFSYLKAYDQESIILEYMVKENMARTPEQEQRLKFLKGQRTGMPTAVAPTMGVINVQSSSNDLLYDHRFVNWKANDIQQYFNNLTLARKNQPVDMVVDEWQKDINIQRIHWDNEQVMQLLSTEIERNFGDMYTISLVSAGAAVDDWVDTIPTIYIRINDTTVRNSELSFLVTGEQITNSTIHLSIMVLLAPTDSTKNVLENEALCRKIIAVKEKHNPRVDTYISTMKNMLIGQLESWIDLANNSQDIY